MTYNEFKMCCILFCKTFEGKEYGEVVKNCYTRDKYIVVTKFPLFYGIGFELEVGCVMWWDDEEELKIPTIFGPKITFKTVKDFLNQFKIPLEDIV